MTFFCVTSMKFEPIDYDFKETTPNNSVARRRQQQNNLRCRRTSISSHNNNHNDNNNHSDAYGNFPSNNLQQSKSEPNFYRIFRRYKTAKEEDSRAEAEAAEEDSGVSAGGDSVRSLDNSRRSSSTTPQKPLATAQSSNQQTPKPDQFCHHRLSPKRRTQHNHQQQQQQESLLLPAEKNQEKAAFEYCPKLITTNTRYGHRRTPRRVKSQVKSNKSSSGSVSARRPPSPAPPAPLNHQFSCHSCNSSTASLHSQLQKQKPKSSVSSETVFTDQTESFKFIGNPRQQQHSLSSKGTENDFILVPTKSLATFTNDKELSSGGDYCHYYPIQRAQSYDAATFEHSSQTKEQRREKKKQRKLLRRNLDYFYQHRHQNQYRPQQQEQELIQQHRKQQQQQQFSGGNDNKRNNNNGLYHPILNASTSHIPRTMSIASEDVGVPASSDSFWELGQYKRTVKRIDDGSKLCTDLCGLIKERGEIESAYAKQLRGWNKKWHDAIDKGPEYGSIEGAWKAVLEEADRRADLHNRIRDRLNDEVYNTIKLWQKEQFHHKPLTGIKESKEMEEAFRKVQKPWSKLYVKVDKCKKDYHTSCKAERSAINNEKNAHGDSSKSMDEQKRLAEKVEKCREEKEKSRDSYEKALVEINNYNSKYMEDMTQVFEKCQDMELKRLKFFKEMLFGIHKCIDLSQETKLLSIYKDYWDRVNDADAGKDLHLWEMTKGTGMPMNWPVFEEYMEDLHHISSHQMKGNRGHGVAAHTIQLKGIKADRFAEEFIEYSPELRRITKSQKNKSELGVGVGGGPGSGGVVLTGQKHYQTDSSPTSSLTTGSSSTSSSVRNNVVLRQQNGSGNSTNGVMVDNGGGPPGVQNGTTSSRGESVESGAWDNWDEDDHQQQQNNRFSKGDDLDDGRPGVFVTALYDYDAVESDELTLQKGDRFEKLEEEDDQGWCKGRKEGRVGLYPANYAH